MLSCRQFPEPTAPACRGGLRSNGGSTLIFSWYRQSRKVVILDHLAVLTVARIPLLRLDITLDVKFNGPPQRAHRTVMKKCLAQRHIAQARRTEQAAIFGTARQIGAQRPAYAKNEKTRISIGRKGAIARHADGDQTEIGELRRRAVATALAAMAIAAMALRRIVEHGEPAQFLRREPRSALLPAR